MEDETNNKRKNMDLFQDLSETNSFKDNNEYGNSDISGKRIISSIRNDVHLYRNNQYSRLYKVIVIGEIGSGKSALIRRYVHDYFSAEPGINKSTIGVDFSLKILQYSDNLEVRLQLWDIAGQERFSSMTRAYYRGTMGALIVFDHTNANSYEAIKRWKCDLDSKCKLPGSRRIPSILVCNKSDLPRDSRLPDDVEISRYVQDNGFAPKWFKTSAKTGNNVDAVFSLIVRYIMALDTWNVNLSDTNEDCFGHKTTERMVTVLNGDVSINQSPTSYNSLDKFPSHIHKTPKTNCCSL